VFDGFHNYILVPLGDVINNLNTESPKLSDVIISIYSSFGVKLEG
jgi:hypothetical protein